jgi:hypothetical protein
MPDVVHQPGERIATIKRQVFQRSWAGELGHVGLVKHGWDKTPRGPANKRWGVVAEGSMRYHAGMFQAQVL